MKIRRTIAVAAALAAVLSACSPALTKQIVKSAIDVALATCIAEHTEIEDEQALREVCKWTDEMAPHVRDLLAARSRGMGKALSAAHAAPACETPPEK